MNNILGYHIYYGEEQKKFLHPELRAYYNEPKYNPCLENEVIADLIKYGVHKDCDYFGVISWRFEKKHGRSISSILNTIKEGKDRADVYSFFSLHTKPNLWLVAERWHTGIIEVAKEIFEKAGMKNVADDLEKIKMSSIYQNAHFTRPDIYEKYVNEWLVPIMSVMMDEGNESIQRKLNVDTRYKSDKRKDHLQKIFGFPFYTLHPFVLERLFSTFLAYQNYKVIHIA